MKQSKPASPDQPVTGAPEPSTKFVVIACQSCVGVRTRKRASEVDITSSGFTDYTCNNCGDQLVVEGYDKPTGYQPSFTFNEVCWILRNVGVDPTCGACMAIAFTNVGLPGDKHTCPNRRNETDRVRLTEQP